VPACLSPGVDWQADKVTGTWDEANMDEHVENLIVLLASVPKLDCDTCPGAARKETDCDPNRQFCTLAIQRILQMLERA
jgi:hypothetical protein